MLRKTETDWARIIQKQIDSGLSAAEFCREKKMDPRYFSLRKQRYMQKSRPQAFIEAKVSPRAELPIKLRWRDMELVLPSGCDVAWLSSLMQSLQHEGG